MKAEINGMKIEGEPKEILYIYSCLKDKVKVFKIKKRGWPKGKPRK